ncbi:MAG TPA: D-alanyl-D-alanine carboxypeptidase family protein [Vineibacter sp.]|nr:D-alanyl-D-alanine carboxypeptidase family protein [Vineibacter sp.]
MRSPRSPLVALFLWLLALPVPPAAAQLSTLQTPTGPLVAGPSIVVDAATGEVLHQRDAGAAFYPASITKLLTLYALFEELKAGRLKAQDRIAFSDYAYGQPPSKLVLPKGTQITVEQAILALILRSANDVAVAVGERISGSEPAFSERMNTTARRLGMTASHFRNPSGWPDPAQVTTARDMAILAIALLRDFPQFYPYFNTHDVMINNVRIGHTVKFLDMYPGADGMKTGFICASGFNLVASAVRDGRRLVGVFAGFRRADLRDEAAVRLFDDALRLKTGGARPKVWQLDNGAVAPVTVLPPGECVPARYDYPGDGAWLGTFANVALARQAHQAAQAKLAGAGRSWLGREWILDVVMGQQRKYAAVVADLEPGAGPQLCALYQAARQFCQVMPPHQLVRPFKNLWR